MTIMTDREINEQWQASQKGGAEQMITPFQNFQNRVKDGKPCISYGLSSAGYDVRLGLDFKIPRSPRRERMEGRKPASIIDPKHLHEDLFDDIHLKAGETLILQPHSFCLGTTMETFNMPRDVIALCTGKSTYARCGILVTPTPFEPGWRGEATLEITNVTGYPALLYPGEGIVQVIFHHLRTWPEITYADRDGKYQDQKGVTPAKM